MTKTIKETDPKTMVTPFAFEIAPQVLYTPLASPLKRGMAMAVDGLLISVLAEQAGWVFILLVGLTLLIQRKSHELGKVLKWGLYLSMFVMMLWVTFENLVSTSSDGQTQESESYITAPSVGEVIGYLPEIIRFSMCEELSCAQTELDALIKVLKQTNLAEAEQKAILIGAIKELALTDDEKGQLQRDISQAYPEQTIEQEVEPDVEQGIQQEDVQQKSDMSGIHPDEAVKPLTDEEPVSMEPVDTEEALTYPLTGIAKQTEEGESHLEKLDEDDAEGEYSLISWAKGILNDLGLGFGWAAFYFTVFTAWFDGQTLGKKLFRIRVIQLDGTGLSLWDAFGRYGGYGAGFATGLLGFLQIYWDANRQAIQDKISATVVVDLTKEKDESMVTLSYIEPLFNQKHTD
ncbi:RDD domain containing protein [Shewanella sediminis HAW-EB3]|uniref:RDD domain containing protein n=1 Tax=Shewanella sediminis (strain HAW-EB3) TaxID=425104 RepID=A8FU10_SHESH|nr:RDD family protein [Shewanella sediminis]ABV36333.1 RDD domain containing protein [Shewanella sediminis HAW-EB3]